MRHILLRLKQECLQGASLSSWHMHVRLHQWQETFYILQINSCINIEQMRRGRPSMNCKILRLQLNFSTSTCSTLSCWAVVFSSAFNIPMKLTGKLSIAMPATHFIYRTLGMRIISQISNNDYKSILQSGV